MPIFSRESLKHSIRPIIVAVLVCIAVYFWGQMRKVSVDMTFRPQIRSSSPIARIELTIYDDDEKVQADISQNVEPKTLPAQRLSLRPGNYQIRGNILDQDGKTHFVQQYVHIPDDDASIELYLRE